ncbi:MAG TPA: hypothetical protein VF928_04080 [Usitatibacteraceae bacterium]
MNRDLLIFLLVILVAGLIGGFVGAEWSDYGRTFSPTGALVGLIGTAAVLFGLAAFFYRQDKRKRRQQIPEEMRGVFDRMLARQSAPVPPSTPPTGPLDASLQASLRRKMDAVNQAKIQTFVSVVIRLGSMTDPIKTADLARAKLLLHPDPIVAALKFQRELLDALHLRSRGDPALMGTSIANCCLGLCELVVEGTIPEPMGREHFTRYIKVFERVHGIKMPFSGGPLDYDTSLEIAREVLSKKGK